MSQKVYTSNQVPVGLTDLQIDELALKVCGSIETVNALRTDKLIKEYLKTQTFAQQPQFSINWDDAPEWANWLAQDKDGCWNFYDNKPEAKPIGKWRCTNFGRFANYKNVYGWRLTLQQRPTPPTLKVEVGQVWKFINNPNIMNAEFKVTEVGNNRVCCKDYSLNFKWEGLLTDFLAKFEQVQI